MKSRYEYRLLVNGHQEFIVQRRNRKRHFLHFPSWDTVTIHDDYSYYRVPPGSHMESRLKLDLRMLKEKGAENVELYAHNWIRPKRFVEDSEMAKDARLAMAVLMAAKREDEERALRNMRTSELTELHRE